MKEAANRISFDRTVGAKCSRVRMLSVERLLKLKISLLSYYPKRRRKIFMRGAHHRRCAREGLSVRHYALLRGIQQGWVDFREWSPRVENSVEPAL